MRVGVLTKAALDMATTRWAQGGVAAVLGGADPDSTDLHLADTLAAGDGLCDVDAVRVLVDEGPTASTSSSPSGPCSTSTTRAASWPGPGRAATRWPASSTPAGPPRAWRSSGRWWPPCGRRPWRSSSGPSPST